MTVNAPLISARNRRLPAAERRQQIVDAVLKVVSEHGVPEATTSRIAQAAGVAEGTLYVHFSSRVEMLTAALDAIFMQMLGLVESSTEPDALLRLKDVAERHTRLMSTEQGGFAYPWVEFIAAGPQMGLREAVAQTQTRAFRLIREIVEEGKAQRAIRSDLDSDQLTWEWLSFAWAENMSCLMGLDDFLAKGHSSRLMDIILEDARA